MNDKLVERLRSNTGWIDERRMRNEAADALEAQQARIVELEAEARRWEAGAEAEAKANWSTRVVSQGMQARIRALEEALRPFSAEAGRWNPVNWPDDEMFEDWDGDPCHFTYGDLRRAKQVLEGK